MTEISELIKDLEDAPEGSRELSDRALLVLNFSQERLRAANGELYYDRWHAPDKTESWRNGEHPDPTQSVDGALALTNSVVNMRREWVGSSEYAGAQIPYVNWVFANTLPLAVTIACLKEKEATS